MHYYAMTNSYIKFQASVSKDSREKFGKLNFILAKGNNSCKSKLSVRKLELDLYYVMTNSYTKFQVNITKDGREKSKKNWSVTDRQTASNLRVPLTSR